MTELNPRLTDQAPAFCQLTPQNADSDYRVALETGYFLQNNEPVLEAILDKYLLPEEAFWAKTLPREFWLKLMSLLGGRPWTELKRPSLVSRWVADMIFSRLPADVAIGLLTLKRAEKLAIAQKILNSQLVDQVAVVGFIAHIDKVIQLMDNSSNKIEFRRHINRSMPSRVDNFSLCRAKTKRTG